MEYLPESLVLLKRKMGWELKDVLYLPHGVIESYAEKRPSYDPDLQKVPPFLPSLVNRSRFYSNVSAM